MGRRSSPPPAPVYTPTPAPVPTVEDAAVKKAREDEEDMLRKRKGRSSTIITGAMGDTSQAPVEKKTLLGQ